MEAKLLGLIQHYGHGLVGGVLFFESMGVPLPGESLLVAAALYAAATGGLDIGWVVLAATAGAVVFFGRFVAFLRTFAALMAGANRMPWARFLVWNALGGAVWASGFGFGAYLLGERVQAVAGPVGFALAAVAAVALGCAALFVRRHEARVQEAAERAMAAEDAARVRGRPR